jgi:hypothetical protein
MFFCETKVKFSVLTFFSSRNISLQIASPFVAKYVYFMGEGEEEAPAISTSCHPTAKEQQGGWDVTFHAAKNKPISFSLSHEGSV